MNDVTIEWIAEGLCDPLGHAGGLKLSVEKSGDAARCGSGTAPPGEISSLPAAGLHLGLHLRDIESNDSLQCNEHTTPELVAVSRAFFCSPLQRDERSLGLGVVAKRRRRPVHQPEFAKYITSLREDRNWTQLQAAAMAKRRHLAVTYQAIRGLETGETKYVGPLILRGISDLYGKKYEEMAAKLFELHYGLRATQLTPVENKPSVGEKPTDPLAQQVENPAFETHEEVKAGPHAGRVSAADKLVKKIAREIEAHFRKEEESSA